MDQITMKKRITKILVTILLLLLTSVSIYQYRAISKLQSDFDYVRDAVNYNLGGRIDDLDVAFRQKVIEQRDAIFERIAQIEANQALEYEHFTHRLDDFSMSVSDFSMNRDQAVDNVYSRMENLREYVQERHLAYDALLEKTSALENILEDLREPLLKTWREKLEVLDSISNELKAIGDAKTQ